MIDLYVLRDIKHVIITNHALRRNAISIILNFIPLGLGAIIHGPGHIEAGLRMVVKNIHPARGHVHRPPGQAHRIIVHIPGFLVILGAITAPAVKIGDGLCVFRENLAGAR